MDRVRDNVGAIGGGLVSGAVIAVELAAGALVALVLTFFLVKDGHRMWGWFEGLFSGPRREGARELGERVWSTLSAYVRGLVVVALFDAVVIGLALLVIGVPLVVPLAVVTFFGAFIPIVGAFVAGLAAALVALVAGGVDDALLVIVVFVVIQQVESEVLYPVVVGRALRLHPVPILLAVTAGGVLFGIAGAALGAPVAAVVTTAAVFWREQLAKAPVDDGVAPATGCGLHPSEPAPVTGKTDST